MGYAAGTLHSSNTFSLPSHERQTRFSGWRGGVALAILCSTFVLLLNIVCAIVAAVAGKPSNGVATAYTGDCTVASRWTTGLQLLINIVSSLLLGASNYCMQRLVAPTRKEIDDAHAKGRWLDIGMPSVRNLSSINKKRLGLWVLLAISSVPLHFFYNSVVFGTIATNYVDFLVVTPDFFTTRGGFKNSYRDYGHEHYQDVQDTLLGGRYLDSTMFENITGVDCRDRYSAPFITSGNGFGVPTPDKWVSVSNPNSSLIESDQGLGEIRTAYGASEYSYCLSEILPEKCQVQFSQTILYIVIVCNVIKVAIMVFILWQLNDETIVTIGDAIKSFLQRPDPTTQDCCLMSKDSVSKIWISQESRHGQKFKPKKRVPWYSAVSGRRWGMSLSLYVLVIITACYLFVRVKTRNRTCNAANGYTQVSCPGNGFGDVNFDYLLHVKLGPRSDIIPYVLLANVPQAFVSVLYLTYNAIFTCMLANREWAGYAIKRAALRVTIPSSNQRSTYFLSLPFVYSVPLIVASILLHWFISQAIFMARITIWENGVQTDLETVDNDKRAGSDLGYSDSALIASIVWGCILVLSCVLIAGICTYPKGLPIGGTNSAIISAACHVRHGDEGESQEFEDIAERPLQWGVTIGSTMGNVGHCCFSDQKVSAPVEGDLYAGIGAREKVE